MYIPNELYNKIKLSLPIACVDILLMHEDKFLLVRRNQEPAKGSWWFPGGRIFKNELIFDAAIRKGQEELRLQLQPIELISVEESIFDENDETSIHTINFVVKMKKLCNSLNIVLDHTHSVFAWFERIPVGLHQCVKRPLLKLNFTATGN